MQTMDFAGRVIYMNTFSKTIAPALRISYMILPPRLLDAWEERMGFYSCTVPAFEQLTLTRFLDGGYFERHLSRMRKHYRAQLAALRAALAEPPFAEICAILRADAGLHFVLQSRFAARTSGIWRTIAHGLPAPDGTAADYAGLYVQRH